MYRYKRALSIALALTAVYMPLGKANSFTKNTNPNKVQVFTITSGPDTTLLGNTFSNYQWGLKNNGDFHLNHLQQNLQSASDTTGDSSNQSASTGSSTVIGPGAYYEPIITSAVPGIDINILPAWDIYNAAANKRPVIVAIIDTGIDYRHPEISNAMWTNPGEISGDNIDNDGNGYIDDIFGWDFYNKNNQTYLGPEDSHGTHAAGTIAANRGELGIAGITDNNYVKLMSLKALGGTRGSGSVDNVLEAIRYAEVNGASICNLSFGTTLYDQRLEKAINNSNMLFIIAAGNGDASRKGYNTDESPIYPSSFASDNIISVANLQHDGTLSNSSNYGSVSVDIAAPGSYVLSISPENQYSFMSGTSMAAPMVSGVAAMLYSYRPDLSLKDVRQIILNSSKKIDSLDGKIATSGMLDAYAALSYQ